MSAGIPAGKNRVECRRVPTYGMFLNKVGSTWYTSALKKSTVVPVMNGHPRDQIKVSRHDRWPLVRGTGGQVEDAKCNTPCSVARLPTILSPPAIHTEYMHCHNYVCNSY